MCSAPRRCSTSAIGRHSSPVEHADQLALNASGIGHRAQDVENGSAAQFLAGADGVFHGAVMGRGEHEADTDFLNAAGHLFRFHAQVDAQLFQQVGTAALGRDGPVAVLGHETAGRGHYERSGGRHVEQVGAITAGADDVYQRFGLDRYLGGQLAHDLGGTGDFINGFAFQTQPHQKRADLGVRGLAVHDDTHHVLHFLPGQVQVGGNAVESFFHVHVSASYCVLRKLRSSS